jgi:hypothetical protein
MRGSCSEESSQNPPLSMRHSDSQNKDSGPDSQPQSTWKRTKHADVERNGFVYVWKASLFLNRVRMWAPTYGVGEGDVGDAAQLRVPGGGGEHGVGEAVAGVLQGEEGIYTSPADCSEHYSSSRRSTRAARLWPFPGLT